MSAVNLSVIISLLLSLLCKEWEPVNIHTESNGTKNLTLPKLSLLSFIRNSGLW